MERYKLLTEVINKNPAIMIIIDKKTKELEDVCDSLPFASEVVEFKTYQRENSNVLVHMFDNILYYHIKNTVSKTGTVEEKVSTEVKKYTENDHITGKSEEIIELYNKFKDIVLSIADGIKIRPRKPYIGFVAKTNFTDVLLQKSKIKIWVNLKKGDINDPKKLARDVSNVGHWGNGNYEINISNDENLEYIISLVKQAYLKNK